MCYTDLAINKNLDIIKLHLNFLFVILKYHQYNYRKLRSYGGSDMKFKNPMLVVTDIEKSVEFYKKVFGLHVIMDFGANKTLTGGLALQTVETYKDFIGTKDISFWVNNYEIYFEEDSWGQRVVRFYDPDKHIVEVGENMKIVCKRFLDSGMTPEQVAEFMNVPMKFIKACMR